MCTHSDLVTTNFSGNSTLTHVFGKTEKGKIMKLLN